MMGKRTVARTVTLTCLLALALPAIGEDSTIPGMVEQIFAGRPDANFVSVVLRDGPRRQYLGFHISTYMQLKELRVYLVPFRGIDVEPIDAALAEDDHDTAFELLLSGMRLHAGAMYVSDVNLDGIRDEAVPLGSGSLRDNFHREQFEGPEAADKAYRSWLQRGLELKSS